MSDLEKVVGRFKTKLSVSAKVENYKNQILVPKANAIFKDQFTNLLQTLVDNINSQVGSIILTLNEETKDRFVIQGQYHRIFFQKNKLELIDNIASINIIPIYIWKGVTKHLGPITYLINTDTEKVKWDIDFGSVENYAINLFNNLVDDKDFSM